MRRFLQSLRLALLASLVFGPALRAQMTVSGRVMSGDRPVQGALVGIPELRIETRTTADGSYNFLIRSTQVFGQRVTLTARHRQFGTASTQIQLTGGTVSRNFVLGRDQQPGSPGAPRDTTRRVTNDTTRRVLADSARRVLPDATRPVLVDSAARPDTTRPTGTIVSPDTVRRAAESQPRRIPGTTAKSTPLFATRFVVDSSDLATAALAGSVDLASALAGRISGLVVTTAATPAGSSLLVYRGVRSLSGLVQPLIVVDGVPIDNTGFRSASQQFGMGGFDYGTPIQDLSLEDVASVTLLDQARAATLYGSRAANGVLVVTTKRGTSTPGMSFSHTFHYSMESVRRLPSYQNSYGQGSGGVFEFFDGRGGGLNDDVEESWGPLLNGQPIIQASQTEPRRPDVRAFVPQPGTPRSYFDGGRTIDASMSLQGSRTADDFRASVGIRHATGVTPGASARWLTAALSGARRVNPRLGLRGTLHVIGALDTDRPGTGFDEINPVAGFTRMGRQVDIAALRANLRDSVEQINWIYTARNNPWFQSQENSNDDHRGHIVASGELSYAISDLLSASLRVGTDNYHESRNFQVGPGWRGGYPTPFGRADFSGSGSQQQKNSSAERLIDLALDTRVMQAIGSAISGSMGAQVRRNIFQSTINVSDSIAGLGRLERSAIEAATSTVTSGYVVGALNHDDFFFVNGGVRVETASGGVRDSSSGSAIFPSVSVGYDVAKTISGLERLGSAVIHASWWRSGSEISARSLAGTYDASSPAASVFGAKGSISGPERTEGTEIGMDLASMRGRLGFGITGYRENSSNVLLAAFGSTTQLGKVSNQGVELHLRAEPVRSENATRWNVDLSFARNASNVEHLGGTTDVALSPSMWGASLNARVGQPVGVIVGSRLLRDLNGNLLLKNGLPLSDQTEAAVFGTWQPSWSSAAASRLHYRSFVLGALVDIRMGGKIFSATNMWGTRAGTLASTLVGRDSGLVVPGIDSASRAPNTTTVSAEAYFHALSAVTEPWVYDASYAKLREAVLTYELPLRFVPGYREQLARISIVGRNLLTWARAPNIDPETTLSVGAFQGFEMGQLPTTRSIGIAFTVTP